MTSPPGADARRVAIDALVRIERDDAYANLALGPLLDRSGLSARDRGLVTDLVYGTTRMRRACDWLVERFLSREPDPVVRAALRIGAYQLVFADVPSHAAVSATVGAVGRRASGFVNAVLRRVATAGVPAAADWPSDAVRLSYPDWIVDWAATELGREEGLATLAAMNRPPTVHERADGYVQDPASAWVAEAVEAQAGERVLDLCAAPGGKATALAATGATVIGADARAHRARLVRDNAGRLDQQLPVVVADGRRPPFGAATFDRVLVDAPCSGLGVLRRRADARWRVQPTDVTALATLQRELLAGAMDLVRPGGRLVYSVCTLTSPETVDLDEWLAGSHAGWQALEPPPAPWQPRGRGAWLLPAWSDTDGMYLLVLERPAGGGAGAGGMEGWRGDLGTHP
jgi:16S rRNA (cytosine967-C5)-methyltransferase